MRSRDAILGRIRTALGRGSETSDEDLAARLRDHPRNLVPARADLDAPGRRDLFVRMAEEAAASVDIVASAEAAVAAIADFLASRNLPAAAVAAPDLADLPWSAAPTMAIRFGVADGDDEVGIAGAFSAIAETGTLLLVSGSKRPTTLNFLPESHVVILRAGDIVGPFEDAWDRLRAAFPEALPRTLNLITGPSRSADIEQTLQMGAHGPRHLHIVLIDDPAG